MNLGVLYEDSDKYDKAVDCYPQASPGADPNNEQARLFLKDAQASLTMYYSPEEEHMSSRFSQVLEIPVTDFELSVRSRNCLKKMNIRTLGDLTRVSEAAAAQQQELRRNVAERDQGDPGRRRACAWANRSRKAAQYEHALSPASSR